MLGVDHEIGSVEPEKKADLIVVDLNRPHLRPHYGDYPALVFYARAPDVAFSVVDGQVVMEDGRPLLLDCWEAVMTAWPATAWHWARTRRGLGSRCVCCG